MRGALASLTGEEGEAVQQQMELVAHTLTIKENEGLFVLRIYFLVFVLIKVNKITHV